MSRADDRTQEEMKRLGINSIIDLVKDRGEKFKLAITSFRTPSDAATARTPESEEGKMISLVIPPQYEVNRLIDHAKSIEAPALAGGMNLSEDEREKMLVEATGARVKALTLHLGIEAH